MGDYDILLLIQKYKMKNKSKTFLNAQIYELY